MHPIIRLGIPVVAAVALATPTFAAEPDWSQVAQALGKSGGVQAGGVYRVGFPRTDLKVSLDGVALRTGFAFGGWVAFQPMGTETMVMGDLVLTQDEVSPGHAQARGRRHRDQRAAQPPAARRAHDALHAHPGPRRPGQACRRHPRRPGAQQDAFRTAAGHGDARPTST